MFKSFQDVCYNETACRSVQTEEELDFRRGDGIETQLKEASVHKQTSVCLRW